jgi:membrane fusion protein, heavy metal efflux system
LDIKNSILIFAILLIFACSKKESAKQNKLSERPVITELGKIVTFPQNKQSIQFIKDTFAITEKLKADLSAPAKVVASVVDNIDKKAQNLVLFSDPELTANFSMYLERLINLKTFRLNLDRAQDLFSNGAATGREVIEAQTLLQNEEAAIIENESKFILAGLDPHDFQNHQIGTVWIISDIPEDDITKFKSGTKCTIKFKSYEHNLFYGMIEEIGEVVDNVTRMVKLRIEMKNKDKMVKPGMFATIKFGVTEGTYLCVPSNSIVTVQGKEYVFVRKNDYLFERREVGTGQEMGHKTVVFSGITENERVVTEGVIQLKGLSFGY